MAYQIPRNVKGEGRILFVFSTKALITTAIGAGFGLLIYWVFSILGLGTIGIIFLLACALLGFAIGTFKVPNSTAFEITRKTGGENIDDVIIRWLRFKFKSKNKIYVYTDDNTKE